MIEEQGGHGGGHGGHGGGGYAQEEIIKVVKVQGGGGGGHGHGHGGGHAAPVKIVKVSHLCSSEWIVSLSKN